MFTPPNQIALPPQRERGEASGVEATMRRAALALSFLVMPVVAVGCDVDREVLLPAATSVR